jgi:outer membrane protein TolC
MVRSRFKSGLVVKSDLLRAEVRIAELEQERFQAQSQVKVARAALNAAMGVEIDRSFRLVTALERGAEAPGSLEAWISRSLENRPDLQQMQFQEMMAEEEVKKAKAAHLPGLYLSGSYEINSEDFSETANNYTLGAVMRFNLFSGFGLQSKVDEAIANLCQTKAMARQLELGIGVETRQAFFMAQSAYQRIGVAQAAVAQAEEGLRIVRNRYESGLFTIVNLLDAEVALQQARTNHFHSLHDFEVATARLNLAAGIIDEDFQ